jgi:hypothetical protein
MSIDCGDPRDVCELSTQAELSKEKLHQIRDQQEYRDYIERKLFQQLGSYMYEHKDEIPIELVKGEEDPIFPSESEIYRVHMILISGRELKRLKEIERVYMMEQNALYEMLARSEKKNESNS